MDEWSRIGSRVSHLGLVPRLPPPEEQGSEQLDLVPFEWEVLAAVDGQRDLHSLAEALGCSEFDVARTVYGLTNAGVVVLDDPAHPGEVVEVGRDLAAFLVPAREALGQGQFDLAAGASRSCSVSTRSCPRRAGSSDSAMRRSGATARPSVRGRHGVVWAPTPRARMRRCLRWNGCVNRWRRS